MNFKKVWKRAASLYWSRWKNEHELAKVDRARRVSSDAEACRLRGENAFLTKEVKNLRMTLDQVKVERDDALAELAKTSADFHDVRESRDKVIEERERAHQACNAYWHDLTRIALLCERIADEYPEYPLKAVERTVRERDELRYKLAGHAAHIKSLEGLLVDAVRERDKVIEERERARQACNTCWHDLERIVSLCERIADEGSLKIAERMMRERDEARVEADSARAIYDQAFTMYIRMATEVAAQRERDAEVRGARWGLDVALDSRKWPVSKWTPEEVCRDAREQGEP